VEFRNKVETNFYNFLDEKKVEFETSVDNLKVSSVKTKKDLMSY
jgi:hypothetical protein